MRIVIPSRGYEDFLEVTLPHWRRMFPAADLRVVTARGDASIDVALAHGATPVVTDVWTDGGATLNKAGALDAGVGDPLENAVCLVADADVLPIGVFPPERTIRRDVLYGCARYHCQDADTLVAFMRGDRRLADLPIILPRRSGVAEVRLERKHDAGKARDVGRKCLGYLQVFRYDPRRAFGQSQTAGGYDNRFARTFPTREAIDDFAVLHLGAQDRRNWAGRVLPRLA